MRDGRIHCFDLVFLQCSQYVIEALNLSCLEICASVRECVCVCVCVCVCLCLCLWLCLCLRVCVCACVCVYELGLVSCFEIRNYTFDF